VAGHQVLNRERAIALSEASQTIERLLGEDSPRLHSAQHDVLGRGLPEYVFAMVVSELTKVVAAQQERIERLEANQKPRSSAKK
jgi:uncharacterized small protein (DUF1192 family)